MIVLRASLFVLHAGRALEIFCSTVATSVFAACCHGLVDFALSKACAVQDYLCQVSFCPFVQTFWQERERV